MEDVNLTIIENHAKLYPLSLSVREAIVDFNVRADTRKQRRIQVGQEEICIGDER